MSKKEKNPVLTVDPFTKWAHKYGRMFMLLFCVYIVAVPLIICAVYGVWPTFKQMLPGAISILAINVPVGIAEVGSYTPVLGSSCYLTFATGNLMNLKVPCAINAQKVAKVEQNTTEGDAIALISTCVSSIVTLIVLFVGVLILIMIPISILCARILWKAGIVKVLPNPNASKPVETPAEEK